MWVMTGNCIRHRAEQRTTIAVSDSKEKLEAWANSFIVPTYYEKDESNPFFPGKTYTWRKSFQKGSPLEMYNTDLEYLDIGTEEDAANTARDRYRDFVNAYPRI
jgi:hypothetical protein